MTIPSPAQWQRRLISGKGESTDIAGPHTLRYFTANPFLRDDAFDLCQDCSTPVGRGRSAQSYSATCDVRTLGTMAGFRIVNILYGIGKRGDPSPASAKWKSILVGTGADRYIEIYHLQVYYTTVDLKHSQIVHAPDEDVLATMDPDGGNGGGCWEGYWWFDQSGPHSIDFSKVRAEIARHLPIGARFNAGCDSLHLDKQEVVVLIQSPDAQCHACGKRGEAVVHFRLKGAHAEPGAIDLRREAGH